MLDRSARLTLLTVLAMAILAPCDLPASEPGAGNDRLTVDHYFRLHEVSEPAFSPDEAWVAYTVTNKDLEKDERISRIWMVSTETGESIPASAEDESAWSPRFSPDGRWLSFLAARDEGETQVWGMDRRGGEGRSLTAVEQGVEDYAWSPDGKRLALVVTDPDPRKNPKDEECDCEEDDPTPPPVVIDRLQFKTDGVGYLDRLRDHVYVLEVDGGAEPIQITSGDYEDSSPAWSPDGRWIAFVSNRGPEPDRTYDTDVWVVSADPDEAERPLRQITDHPGADDSPTWTPDGQWIAYLSTIEPKFFDYSSRDLRIAPAEGGPSRALTEGLDRVMYDPVFDPRGDGVYVLLEDQGEQQLARVGIDGSIDRLVTGDKIVWALDPAPSGAVALTVAEPHRPSEIHVLDADRRLRRLSRVSDEVLGEVRLGTVESFEVTSHDGTKIQSFLVKPPGFRAGERYPTILWVHGGPMGQYDWTFDFWAQLLATQGYLVVLPNYRGSTGWGTDFSAAIWADWGNHDLRDNLAALDWAIEEGLADGTALGIGGWSYGGYMTNHAIVKTDRFDAAITGAGASLYVTGYGHDQYQRWWEQELGVPWDAESRALWERISPFNDVENVTTPTLVLCGEDDWNVPAANSEQLYQALKSLGKAETLLVIYPGEDHSISVPSYEKDRFERYLSWFEKHVEPGD